MKKDIISAVALITIALMLTSCASILKSRGLHPDHDGQTFDLKGKKALIVTTSHGVLSKPGESTGDSTGVFASEMTIPYYEFQDNGNMEVHVASIKGGQIPIDPQSFNRYLRSKEDERFMEDEIFQAKVKNSIPVFEVDFTDYDVVFFAGGWGAAYDFGNDALGQKIADAYYDTDIIFGSVCHGAIAFTTAKDRSGESLIKGRTMTGVTQNQLDQLDIAFTPLHPEEELKKAGANYQCSTGRRDFFETLTVVDEEKRFVTGQNQNSSHETGQMIMEIVESQSK
ncbi:MAG: type 1 glutamine amidotransferase domain-containing protein [Bacteroidota bacterium]